MKERSLLANSAWGIFSQAIRGVVGLVFIPIVISRIGITGYGLYSIALIFSLYQGLASQADFGYPSFLINFISSDKFPLNDREIISRLNGLNSSLVLANTVMGIVLLALSQLVTSVFKVAPSDMHEFMQSLLIILAANFFSIVFISGNSVWIARHQNSYVKKIETITYFLFVGLAIGFLMIRPSLISMTWAFFFSQVFLALRIGWDTKRQWQLLLRPGAISLAHCRTDWPDWKPFFFMKLNGFAQKQSDLTFVSVLLGPHFTAVYDISMKVPGLFKTLIGRVAEVLAPYASHRRQREHLPFIKTLSESLVALAIALGVYISATALFFARDLCRIWLGPEQESIASTLFSASLINITFPAASILLAVLIAQGNRPRQMTWWPTWISLFNIVTTIPATYFFGVQATILLTVLQFAMLSVMTIAFARTDFAFDLRPIGKAALKTAVVTVPLLWLGRFWLPLESAKSEFWLKFLTVQAVLVTALLAVHWRQLLVTKGLLRSKNQDSFDRTAPETASRI